MRACGATGKEVMTEEPSKRLASMESGGSHKASRSRFIIQTFTVRFDPVEDRMRLDVEDANGNKQSFYLTRRLLDKVIPAITAKLEQKTPSGVPSELMQAMVQSKARQSRAQNTPATAVEARSDAPQWLCKTVRVTETEAGMVIAFSNDGGQEAGIALREEQVRATLDILHSNYKTGEWDTSVFPDWLETDDSAAIDEARYKN